MSVDYFVNFMFSWKIILFYSFLEGFRTSLQFSIKLVRILLYGRVFQTYYIFKPIFENPIHWRAVGWATMPCMVNIENHFKHVHEMGGRKYEIYTWSYYVFNWYHWIVSIGSNIDILFVYSYICFIYVCLLFI